MVIFDLINNSCKQFPHKLALIEKEKKVTFSELRETIETIAGNLLKLGIKKGDKVCLLLENNLEFIYSFLALTRIGCIVIPLDKGIKSELKTIFNESGAIGLIIEESGKSYIQSIFTELNSIKYVFVLSLDRIENVFYPFNHLYVDSKNKVLELMENVTEDDIACIIYTSGTIKRPKGVMLTHFCLVFNVLELKKVLGTESQDIFLNVLPLFHCYGLCTTLLLPLYISATLVLHNNFSPRDVLSEIEKRKITVFACVPLMYEKIKLLINDYDLSSVKWFISSGAPLPFSLVKDYKENHNIDIINAYGSSETNTISIAMKSYESKRNSVGKLLPSIKVQIIDEAYNQLPFNVEGEIVLKTPKIMKGYYNLPEETAQVLKDGWFYTGDIGYLTEEGELYITGRKKDMFCVAGKKVFRHDVEEVLMSSSYFKDVFVDAINDPKRGELIRAQVILIDGIKLDEDQILKYCRDTMAPHKVPKKIIICKKIDKQNTWKTTI